jgi:hypothetical protein
MNRIEGRHFVFGKFIVIVDSDDGPLMQSLWAIVHRDAALKNHRIRRGWEPVCVFHTPLPAGVHLAEMIRGLDMGEGRRLGKQLTRRNKR